MKRGIFAIVLAIGLLTSQAHAWWNTGHSYLTHQAVQHLPHPLQMYVANNFTLAEPYAASEPPGAHYIDIDIYPEFHAHTFPRNLNVLYATYGTAYVNGNGIAPWTMANYRQTITQQMTTATTTAQWIAMWRNMGEMAHYIEDIHNPLHTTENFNGQLTGNGGIHARYEGEMIDRHFGDLPISASPQDCVYISDQVDHVLDSIDVTWQYVDDIMAADTLAKTFGSTSSPAYYNSLWSSTSGFTHTQFQLATEMIASTWYSAWVDAGSPVLPTVPEPASVLTLAIGCGLFCCRRARQVTI